MGTNPTDEWHAPDASDASPSFTPTVVVEDSPRPEDPSVPTEVPWELEEEIDEETDEEDRLEENTSNNPDSVFLVTKPFLPPSAITAEDINQSVTVYEPLDEVAQTCRIFSTRHGISSSKSDASTAADSESERSERSYITAHDDDQDDHLEIYLEPEMAMWWINDDGNHKRPLEKDEYLVIRVTPTKTQAYNVKTVSDNVKFQGVIKREYDNLSKEEIIKHSKQVIQAKLEELKRWHELDCFRRMPRQKATNKVDGTWVLKWKKVRKEINGVSTWVRIIKARLTARGFKDIQAFSEGVTTYSGTASKWAQRMINQHAAQFEYEIFSMDISAAFLKGMTYEKIAKLTGEPLRSVQFDFPRQDAWLLCQLP